MESKESIQIQEEKHGAWKFWAEFIGIIIIGFVMNKLENTMGFATASIIIVAVFIAVCLFIWDGKYR